MWGIYDAPNGHSVATLVQRVHCPHTLPYQRGHRTHSPPSRQYCVHQIHRQVFVLSIAYVQLCNRHLFELTHWGRVTHICVGKLIIICSVNGLSPGRRQDIIGTNDGILLIWPWGTKFNEIFVKIHISSFKRTHLNMSSAKRQPNISLLGNLIEDGFNVIIHKRWFI